MAAREAATHHDHRGQRPRAQNHRCEAKPLPGLDPKLFHRNPTEAANSARKKEIAPMDALKNRRASGIGLVNFAD